MVINWTIAIYFWWLIPTPIRSFFQPSKMKLGHLMMKFFAACFFFTFLSDRSDRRSGKLFNFYRSCYRNRLLWPVWFDQSGLCLVLSYRNFNDKISLNPFLILWLLWMTHYDFESLETMFQIRNNALSKSEQENHFSIEFWLNLWKLEIRIYEN